MNKREISTECQDNYMGKLYFFNKCYRNNCISSHTRMQLDCYLTPHTNINSKSNLNVSAKATKQKTEDV